MDIKLFDLVTSAKHENKKNTPQTQMKHQYKDEWPSVCKQLIETEARKNIDFSGPSQKESQLNNWSLYSTMKCLNNCGHVIDHSHYTIIEIQDRS